MGDFKMRGGAVLEEKAGGEERWRARGFAKLEYPLKRKVFLTGFIGRMRAEINLNNQGSRDFRPTIGGAAAPPYRLHGLKSGDWFYLGRFANDPESN
jgi:hypothetical protein